MAHGPETDKPQTLSSIREAKTFPGKVGKTIDFCSEIMGDCAGYIVLLTSIIIVYEVVLRHFFNAPTIWVFDISGYLLVWFGFFSASYGMQKGSHISIDLLTSALSASTKTLLDIISHIIVVIYSVILFIFGLQLCFEHYQSMELQPTALYFPVYIVEVGMVIGVFL